MVDQDALDKTSWALRVNTLFILFLLAGGAVCLLLGAGLLRRMPQLGFIVSGIHILTVWEFPGPLTIARVAGTSIHLTDAISALFLLTACFSVRAVPAHRRLSVTLLALVGALAVASLLRGIPLFGVGTAFNEARYVLGFLTGLLWALVVDWHDQRIRAAFRRYAVLVGWGLTALALYHWSVHGLGGASDFLDATGEMRTSRVLVAGQALFIALCGFVCLSARLSARRVVDVVAGLVFFAVAALSQHRSVWSAVFLAAMVALVVARSSTKLRASLLLTFSSVPLLVYLASPYSAPLVAKLSASATDLHTYEARISSWQTLIAEAVALGLPTILFGLPFGSGYRRIEPNGLLVEFQPHNVYVTLFLRVGLVGLTIYVLLLAHVLKNLISGRQVLPLALFVSVVVFGWAYGPQWHVHIFLAYAFFHGQSKKHASLPRGRQAGVHDPKSSDVRSSSAPLLSSTRAAAGVALS